MKNVVLTPHDSQLLERYKDNRNISLITVLYMFCLEYHGCEFDAQNFHNAIKGMQL